MNTKRLYLIIALAFSCSNISAENVHTNHQQFVGVWAGEYLHKDKIRKDTWTQTRKADGTFKLVYKTSNYGATYSTETNEGTWWLEGEYFYEKQNGSFDKPDKYSYEFIGNNQIKFTELSTDDKTSEDIPGYSFIDAKVED